MGPESQGLPFTTYEIKPSLDMHKVILNQGFISMLVRFACIKVMKQLVLFGSTILGKLVIITSKSSEPRQPDLRCRGIS